VIVMFWIVGGVTVLTLVAWRLRAAIGKVDTILAESDAAEEDQGPSAITWPHPPRRLWSARR
jgi:hypothetical protein